MVPMVSWPCIHHQQKPSLPSATEEAVSIEAHLTACPSYRRASLLDTSRHNAPPLVKLRRSLRSDRSASFGSIRFPARTMPAKFVHLAPDSDAGVVVRLLVDTWKLANPCAVLALSPPSAGPMAPMTPMAPANKADEVNSRLMLRSKLTPDEVNIKLRRGWAKHVKSALLEAPQLATTIIGPPGVTP